MNKVYQISVIAYTLLMVTAAWGVAYIETGYLGIKDLGIYPLFPAFFWLWGIILMTVVKKTIIKDPKTVTNIYLLMKTLKNVFSAIIAIYVFFNIQEMRTYVLAAFGTFYIINLISETVFIFYMEKANKEFRKHAK